MLQVWLKAMELALIGSAAGLAEALLPGGQGGGAGNAGAQEGAKKLLDRALTALPRRKHIKVSRGHGVQFPHVPLLEMLWREGTRCLCFFPISSLAVAARALSTLCTDTRAVHQLGLKHTSPT